MSQSLDRALVILRELGEGPRTLDDLAAKLDVHKSTVLRLLRTLEKHRFVQREGARHHRLGAALFDLSFRALEERDVRRAVEPHLRELNARTGHTVHLASYEAGEVIYIDKYDSRHQVRMYSRIGKQAALHCTAVGKILVGALPEAERRAVARSIPYPRLTANTITDADAYLAELDQVRQCGYAVDRREHEDFIHCIGAPVRGPRGEVLAAMSLSVPEMLLDFEGLLGLLPDLLGAARAASADCGWRQEAQENTQHRTRKDG